jgi:chromosome segregation ATPase
MNQPTRDEFQDLKRRVERLEQQTEPIKITRLEIEQGDLSKRLGSVQEDVTILRLDVTALKVEMRDTRADILKVRESQADLRDTLKEHGQRLKSIEQTQVTHTEVLEQIVNLSEDHTKRFDRIDENIAELRSTQTELRSTQTELRSAQTEQGRKLDLILKLLQPGGEQQ